MLNNPDITAGRKLPEQLGQPLMTSREVETPNGIIRVNVNFPEEYLNRRQEILDSLTETGPVADWLNNLNEVRERPDLAGMESADHHRDALTGREHVSLTIHDFVYFRGGIQFAAVTYRFKNSPEASEIQKRTLVLRPDAATSLVIVVSSETGKRYLMTQSQFRDGVGGVIEDEAPAGTSDVAEEALEDLITRELREEGELDLSDVSVARVLFKSLFSSPGTTGERIAGFIDEVTLDPNQMAALMEATRGHDAGENIATALIPFPQAIDATQASGSEIVDYVYALRQVKEMATEDDGDIKFALLLSLYLNEVYEGILLNLAKRLEASTN